MTYNLQYFHKYRKILSNNQNDFFFIFQSILSTASSQFPDENLWCDEEQAMESTAPKKVRW